MAGKKRVEIYAKRQDRSLDEAYHYGRSSQGFGYEANQGSADEVLELLDAGVHDIEKLAEAAHVGWGKIAKTYDDPVYKTKPEKRQKRVDLANTAYSALLEDEKEKDRVVARSLLDLWQKEHKLKLRGRLENIAATAAIIGIAGGAILLFSTYSAGNVQLSPGAGVLGNWRALLGGVLLIIGVVAGYFWFKEKR